MLVYLAKRLLMMVPLLIGITLISFVVIHLAPGEPTDMQTDLNPKSSVEMRDRLRERYNLDKRGFEDLMRTLLFELGRDSEVLFFFAGHGIPADLR